MHANLASMHLPVAQQLHPLSRAHALNTPLRRYLQSPYRILRPYIHPGMHVLDLGCGTGFFTIPLAEMLTATGSVTGVDVQAGMLKILQKRLKAGSGHATVHLHKNTAEALQISGLFDFVLAFYSFHEVKYLENLLEELQQHLKPGARILIAEQRFHVPAIHFKAILSLMKLKGYCLLGRPRIFFSRAALFEYPGA